MMLKVLHFIGSLETGGTETMLLAYLRTTKNKEIEHVVCTIYPRESLKKEFHDAGIKVYSLNIPSKPFFFLTFPKFALFLKKTNPDIVHSYLIQESLVNRIVGRLMGKAVVCGKRDIDKNKSFWKVWLDRMTIWLADVNISNSRQGLEELLSYGVPKEKALYVPNGKDLSPFEISISKEKAKNRLGFGKEIILIGCISRLFESKGQEYLIRAMPRLLKEKPEIKLLVVGGGRMKDYLEKISQELGVSKDVIFLGERKDIPELLKAFDVFVFPSLREGMPGALMEAMAAGLPVVATNIGGNVELVENNETGLLVLPANPREISTAVLKILDTPKLSATLGKKARNRIKNDFTLEKMAATLDGIYLDFENKE